MKQTAIQQAITMVRSRIDSMDETLMGKHTIHHLQQVERGLYELLEEEKEQMYDAYEEGYLYFSPHENFNEYYNETYGHE
jgi:hypothetical protein